jgi:hypothetical protein
MERDGEVMGKTETDEKPSLILGSGKGLYLGHLPSPLQSSFEVTTLLCCSFFFFISMHSAFTHRPCLLSLCDCYLGLVSLIYPCKCTCVDVQHGIRMC